MGRKISSYDKKWINETTLDIDNICYSSSSQLFVYHLKRRNPTAKIAVGLLIRSLAMTYFHMNKSTLSSALRRFTILFGMERRGTTSLWSPNIKLSQIKKVFIFYISPGWILYLLNNSYHPNNSNDRVKPLEQLVSVSYTCCHASTSDLSTSWSRTTLTGLMSREVLSSGEFRA